MVKNALVAGNLPGPRWRAYTALCPNPITGLMGREGIWVVRKRYGGVIRREGN